MSDPTYSPQDYIQAHDIIRYIGQNLAIQYQAEGGENWDRETMQKHMNSRAAIIHVQKLLIEAGEQAAGIFHP